LACGGQFHEITNLLQLGHVRTMSDTNDSETVMSVAGDRDEAANFDM